MAGKKRRIIQPVADIRSEPADTAALTSQLLLGEDVQLLETPDGCPAEHSDGYSLVRACKDDYVGYVKNAALNDGRVADRNDDTGDDGQGLTHYVRVPRSFLYPRPDMKAPVDAVLSLGSRLRLVNFVEVSGMHYGITEQNQAVFADHLSRLASRPDDYVDVAESLERTPYLWGGTSAFGIDCSGLVQLSLGVAGLSVLRDSHAQCETIGSVLAPGEALRRGDLVFWCGHVAIMCDGKTCIHANGASMDVRFELLEAAINRITGHYGLPVAHRRPYLSPLRSIKKN